MAIGPQPAPIPAVATMDWDPPLGTTIYHRQTIEVKYTKALDLATVGSKSVELTDVTFGPKGSPKAIEYSDRNVYGVNAAGGTSRLVIEPGWRHESEHLVQVDIPATILFQDGSPAGPISQNYVVGADTTPNLILHRRWIDPCLERSKHDLSFGSDSTLERFRNAWDDHYSWCEEFANLFLSIEESKKRFVLRDLNGWPKTVPTNHVDARTRFNWITAGLNDAVGALYYDRREREYDRDRDRPAQLVADLWENLSLARAYSTHPEDLRYNAAILLLLVWTTDLLWDCGSSDWGDAEKSIAYSNALRLAKDVAEWKEWAEPQIPWYGHESALANAAIYAVGAFFGHRPMRQWAWTGTGLPSGWPQNSRTIAFLLENCFDTATGVYRWALDYYNSSPNYYLAFLNGANTLAALEYCCSMNMALGGSLSRGWHVANKTAGGHAIFGHALYMRDLVTGSKTYHDNRTFSWNDAEVRAEYWSVFPAAMFEQYYLLWAAMAQQWSHYDLYEVVEDPYGRSRLRVHNSGTAANFFYWPHEDWVYGGSPAPVNPTNLSNDGVGLTWIALSWDDGFYYGASVLDGSVEDYLPVRYLVEMTSPSSKTIGRVVGNRLVVHDLLPNTAYTFRVRAEGLLEHQGSGVSIGPITTDAS